MNIKDIFFVVSFALVTTWGIDYFILSRYKVTENHDIQSGQSFNAPENEQIIRPFNFDLHFNETKRVAPTITEVITNWGYLVFSSEGACLERLEFKHAIDNHMITTIYPSTARDHKAFLIALDENTPYYFNLVKQEEINGQIVVGYEAAFDKGILYKKFIISKDACKIDLTISVVMRDNHSVRARIFYPAPFMSDIKQNAVAALVQNVKGSLEKIPYQKLNVREGWWAPTLFGAENKYFICALVADPQHMIERAYYKVPEEEHLISILETVPMEQSNDWTISFYCGPKDAQAISLVDERLEQTLDYSGILAPLSKLLLSFLKFLYGYVHNYGVAILLLTLFIKLVLLPFSIGGEKSLKKTQEMQKKMQYLQQRYKNDPERLRQEQAELMKKYGIPQLAGCLPMLAQLPIFIALSRVLSNSIDLYKAPFFGWITDLSNPDPYYILPLVIIIAMILQALAGDAKQRVGMMGAALIFGAFSVHFAAGLVLYICASTLLGVAQMTLQKNIRVS